VRALHLSAAPHRLAVTATAGRLRAQQRHGGPGAALQLREVPRPARPPGWVRIRPILAGICGSDRKTVRLELGRALTAFYGLPREGVVPGHEVVGTVLEADPDSGLAEGDRVVPEPLLSCVDKGLPRCARCGAGEDHRCAHQADAGPHGGGLGFGFHARYGGGWAEELVAPADRVHPVPDHLDDRTAVLVEPTAVAVHAVLRDPPRAGDRALVIGPGTVGLALVHALTTLAPGAEVTVVGLDPATHDLARRAGAAEVVADQGRPLLAALAARLGSPLRGGVLSGPILEDGVDVVYDTVGTRQTIDDGLRALRPGGRLVLVASSAVQKVDWTLVWHRELAVQGSGYYAVEDVPATARVAAGRRRALAVALEVLTEHRPGHLVTHVYRLDEPRAALATAEAGPARDAVKVAFVPEAA
jgi:threonine dehydrogenase-like Zn-dependent dehydrogenase